MEGNRCFPLRCYFGQRGTALERAGKRNACCFRMIHQIFSNLIILSMKQLKHPLWDSGFFHRSVNQISKKLASFGMGGMSFYDDWAPHCQCGYGVCTHNRNGQGEVTGSNYQYRTNRHIILTQTGKERTFPGFLKRGLNPLPGFRKIGKDLNFGNGSDSLCLKTWNT